MCRCIWIPMNMYAVGNYWNMVTMMRYWWWCKIKKKNTHCCANTIVDKSVGIKCIWNSRSKIILCFLYFQNNINNSKIDRLERINFTWNNGSFLTAFAYMHMFFKKSYTNTVNPAKKYISYKVEKVYMKSNDWLDIQTFSSRK